MKIRCSYGVALVTGCALSGTALADSVNVMFDPGTTTYINSITGFMTTGSMMDGMLVTAWFDDNSSETAVWEDAPLLGSDAGRAIGDHWGLREIGDTFYNPWYLTNTSGKSITRVLIDAMPGNTVFDTDFGGLEGTAGSSSGKTFMAGVNGTGLDIVATYIDQVAISGEGPVGDLWRYLQLDFVNAAGLRNGLELLIYDQDTDNVGFGGDIVPLPSAAGMGLASVALLGVRRRR